MDKKYKYFHWVVLATLIILSVFLLVQMNHTLNTATTSNTVSFSGEGKVLAKPDVAVLDFAIVTEATTSKQAQDNNSAKSKTVVDFLKSQNIEDKDIKTIGYNIYPQYRYPQYSNPEITSYQVNQAMEIKVRNLDNISKILDGVISAGVNQVNNLSFQIDNPDQVTSDAREKAIQNAKDKAKELESQLGIKLGRIVNFSENVGGYPEPIYYAKGAGIGGGGGPTVPTGENEVSVSVTLTYQIK